MLNRAVIVCLCIALGACNSEITKPKNAGMVVSNNTIVSGSLEKEFWTLYRNSPVDSTMRIHVASFDSTEGGSSEVNYAYNQENCVAVSKSLGGQVGVTAHYWCERGRFKN